ncbi:MAG: hypothetical protein J5509_04210 [Lachnospiraceae bacterium]|nr:hypothetical protein [Lachnospiraceae bacterium]
MNDLRGRIRTAHIVTLLILTIYFVAVYLLNGVGVYNDSDQYINMHMRREPAYPVFLFLIRSIAPACWMQITAWIQTVLVIASSHYFIRYISDRFDLNSLFEYLICAFVILPYAITPFFSAMKVHMSCAIMSEAVAMPLFLLFFVSMHRAVSDKRIRDLVTGLLLAFLLSVIRSNMTVLLIAWLLTALIVLIPRKILLGIILSVAGFVMAFGARDVVTKAYNLAFNGAYVGNEYTSQTALANIFYVTDKEAGEYVEDPSLNFMFQYMYMVMDVSGWSYHKADDNVLNRAMYLEEVHDRIKFEAIEYSLRDIIENSTGIHDYIGYNALAEEYAGSLIRILFPKCFGRWFADYIILGSLGVMRSIAFVHPIMIPVVIGLIAASAILMILLFKTEEKSPAAWLIFMSLLLIFGNAYGTAVIIMCLARYMIYGFAVFYTAFMVGIVEIYRIHKGIVVE